MILDFGKHKGTDIEDVPLEYMIFLAGYRLKGTKRVKSDNDGSRWVKTNRKEVREFAEGYLLTKCWHCGGVLVPVGNSRSNGAAHDDWDGRILHKKCWKELSDEAKALVNPCDGGDRNRSD
jgi:hypothetical protein